MKAARPYPVDQERNCDRKHIPKNWTTARGTDGSQVEKCPNQPAVVSFEIAVELRNLDKLGRLVGHKGTSCKQEAPYEPLICPTAQGPPQITSRNLVLVAGH
jgi:hypothetical protein